MSLGIHSKINDRISIIEDSRNALLNAINENKVDEVVAAFKAPEGMERPLPNGELPFHYAVRLGKFELLEKILKEVKPSFDKKDPQGLMPVDHAMIRQDSRIIALILGHQIGQAFDTAFFKTMNSAQALHLETLAKEVEELRSEKIHLPKLHAAASKGNLEDVKKFLNSTDPNPYDFHGMTPLHYAVLRGKKEVAMWLLQHGGAKADILTQTGRSLLHLASIGGKTELISYLIDTLKMDLNKTDQRGNRALHYAMALEDLSAAKLLIQKGANPVLISAPPSNISLLDPTVTPLDTLLTLARKRSDQRDPLALTKLQAVTSAMVLFSWADQLTGGTGDIGDYLASWGQYFVAAQNCESQESFYTFLFSTLVLPFLARCYHHGSSDDSFDAPEELLFRLYDINKQGESLPKWALGLDAYNIAKTYGLVAKGVLKGLSGAWKHRTYETFRPIRNAIANTALGVYSLKSLFQGLGHIALRSEILSDWDQHMNIEGESFRKANLGGKARIVEAFWLEHPKWQEFLRGTQIDPLKDHEQILALDPKNSLPDARVILNNCIGVNDCGKQFRVTSARYHPASCKEDYCNPTFIKVTEAYEKLKDHYQVFEPAEPPVDPCEFPKGLPAEGPQRVLDLDLNCPTHVKKILNNCYGAFECGRVRDRLVELYEKDDCEGPCEAAADQVKAAYDILYPSKKTF